MNILTRLIVPCRVVYSAHDLIPRIYINRPIPRIIKKVVLSGSTRAMSQRSITSFFKVTPPKGTNNSSVNTAKVKEEKTDEPTENIKTPDTNGKDKRSSKRQRLESSGSESDIKPTEVSPTASGKKKQVKRQRIESSGSEADSPKSETKTKHRKDSASSEPETLETKENIKVAKKSPKTYASPKSKKAKSALQSKTLSEKKVNVKKEASSQSDGEGSEETDVKNKESDGEGSPQKDVKDVKSKKEVKKEEVTEKVAEVDYNPTKPKYHPIKDACWAQGEEVPYLAIAKTFEAIEAISARLKMIEILANLFRSVIALTPEDLLPCIYMCLNQLAPAYHSLELGIAETYLMKAVGQCTGCSLAQVRAAARRSGDLGQAAELARSSQRTLCAPPPLKARRVFAALKDIAHMTGQASVNKKISKIQSLYVACRHSEARYLIRSLEGKLRIGLAEQSVLQALALATTLTPPDPQGVKVLDASKGLPPDQFKAMVESNALTIKTTYCECPNYELVVPVLLREGVAALPRHCRLTPGIPLKPMLAHPTKGVHEVFNRFEGSRFTCEWKYDGERAQIHVPGEGRPRLDHASIYSRNQEDNTSKYPDILRRLPSLLKESVVSCVLDCEAVAYDTQNKQILPFQILSTRKRKDASEADIKVQVCVFVFDLLYLNGEPLVRTPLERRRGLLQEHFNEVPGSWQLATSKDCSSMEEVQQFLEEAVRGSCEGLMVKALEGHGAHYDIARRSHNWLKLKKDYLEGVGDTLDVVVLGGYQGRGRRRGAYGGFLLACRDPATDHYQSLCKIGTGFTDDDLQTLSAQLNEHLIDAPRNYYMFDSSHSPDAWFSAASVWEVRCADLSLSPSHRAAVGLVAPDKGISLRFPRFVRVREDKTPEEATTAQQIASMYLAQDQVKNQTTKPLPMDDFY